LVSCAHAGIENVSVNGPPFRTHIVGPVVRPERRLVETIEMPKILAIPCGVLRSGENEMKILFDQLYAWIVRETGDRSVGCTIADEATCPLGPSCGDIQVIGSGEAVHHAIKSIRGNRPVDEHDPATRHRIQMAEDSCL